MLDLLLIPLIVLLIVGAAQARRIAKAARESYIRARRRLTTQTFKLDADGRVTVTGHSLRALNLLALVGMVTPSAIGSPRAIRVTDSGAGWIKTEDSAYRILPGQAEYGAIVNAIFTAVTGTQAEIIAPAGTLPQTVVVTWPVMKDINFEGSGRGSVFSYTGSGIPWTLHGTAWDSAQINGSLRNMRVTLASAAGSQTGISVRYASGSFYGFSMTNVETYGFPVGIKLDAVLECNFTNLHAKRGPAASVGLYLTGVSGAGTNGNTFTHTITEGSTTHILLEGNCNNNSFHGGEIESSGTFTGIKLLGTASVAPSANKFIGLACETDASGTSEAILITSSGAGFVPTCNFFIGIDILGFTRPFHITYGAENVFKGCYMPGNAALVDVTAGMNYVEDFRPSGGNLPTDNSGKLLVTRQYSTGRRFEVVVPSGQTGGYQLTGGSVQVIQGDGTAPLRIGLSGVSNAFSQEVDGTVVIAPPVNKDVQINVTGTGKVTGASGNQLLDTSSNVLSAQLPVATTGAIGAVKKGVAIGTADPGALGAQSTTAESTTAQTQGTTTQGSASVATTAATNVAPFGYTTGAQADAIRAAVNLLVTDVANIASALAAIKVDVAALNTKLQTAPTKGSADTAFSNIVTGVNSLRTRYEELISKLQAAGVQT